MTPSYVSGWRRFGQFVWQSIPAWIFILLAFLERLDKLISKWRNADFLFDKLKGVPGGGVAAGVLGSTPVQLALIVVGLFWIAWVVAQGSSDRALPSLKRWSRKRALAVIAGTLVLAVGYELLYGRYESVQTVPPQMIAWGTEPYHALVDGKVVEKRFRELYVVMLVVRGVDNTIDADDDTVIDRSRLFQIPDDRVLIELAPSEATLMRVFPRGVIEFTLLCIPKNKRVKPEEVRTINDAKEAKAAIVCDRKAASATANLVITPRPDSGPRGEMPRR